MFSWFKRDTVGHLPNLTDWEKNCPDCGTENSSLHELFCTKERCPFCRGQLISCECINDVLNLTAEERGAVEEYIDDSMEPLCGIMNRWKDTLERKGRIPFRSLPLDVTPKSLILVSSCGALPFVRKLLAEGVPIDATNDVGYTSLMAAARSYRRDVLAFLLQKGASVHRQDIYGHTPLHCAVSSPSFESQSSAQTQAECVRLLLKQGASPNAIDQQGGTPLMKAAWFGCLPSVESLLQAGADLNLSDAQGRTAQDLAAQRGNEEIVHLLASHGAQ